MERTILSGSERLQQAAARAQETDQLAKAAEAEAARLRKEMKRARKTYKVARQAAKQAAREAERARAELSRWLDGAFRELVIAHQEETMTRVKGQGDEAALNSPDGVPKLGPERTDSPFEPRKTTAA